MITMPDFLDDYPFFRQYCDLTSYKGEVNPVDGVEYPGISLAVPCGVSYEIKYKLEHILKKNIKDVLMFLRLTVKGENAPHQAHTDTSMGDFALFIYLNRPEHCQGGTSMVTHIATGMDSDPHNQEEMEAWENEHSDPDKWESTEMVDMASNTGLLFDCKKMHRAEPQNGFGKDAKDGRLMLICFFKVADD